VSYDNGHKAVLSGSRWTKALEILPGHLIGTIIRTVLILLEHSVVMAVLWQLTAHAAMSVI